MLPGCLEAASWEPLSDRPVCACPWRFAGAGGIHPECLGGPGVRLPQPTSPVPATLCLLPWTLLLSPRPGATWPLGVKMCPVACPAARALGLVTPGQGGSPSAPYRHSLTRQHPHIFGVLAGVISVKSVPSRDSHKSSQVETVSASHALPGWGPPGRSSPGRGSLPTGLQ